MRTAITILLSFALAGSWLWFSTRPSVSNPNSQSENRKSDEITVWVNELLGSPDEANYYALADLWNSIEPTVKLKMCVLSHGGYESKLRVAIASGQPPDICFGGMDALEMLEFTGKSSDVSVPIPARYFPDAELQRMSPVIRKSLAPDSNGRPRIFPVWRYAYGGFLLCNNDMLKAAGYNDDQIRAHGWTVDQFRDACRKMTHGNQYAFGAALIHVEHLFLNEFGPGIWGREITRNSLLGYNPTLHKWTIHPDLTEDQICRNFLLFHQLINVDKTWDRATLSMNLSEILDDVAVHRRLAMTFGEVAWAPRLRMEIWRANEMLGNKQPEPPPLTSIWMPATAPGQKGTPLAGVMGFSVMKQDPYRGDAHTENAMRVAFFLTHPVNLARSQIRTFRHLPADPKAFGEIYPELLHSDDKWVKFYNEVMDSDLPVISDAPSPGEEGAAQYAALRARVDQWLARQGMDYLQQVIYQKLSPEEGARKFFHELKALQ